MPNLLNFLGPYKYALYAAGAAIALSAAAYTGHRVTSLAWQADMAAQERAASALYIDALNTKAAVERANTDLAINLDTERNKHHDEIAATGDAFERDLIIRVRNAERRARGSCAMPGTPGNPGNAAASEPSGDDGRGQIDTASLRALRDGCKRLQVDIGLARVWALGVGR